MHVDQWITTFIEFKQLWRGSSKDKMTPDGSASQQVKFWIDDNTWTVVVDSRFSTELTQGSGALATCWKWCLLACSSGSSSSSVSDANCSSRYTETIWHDTISTPQPLFNPHKDCAKKCCGAHAVCCLYLPSILSSSPSDSSPKQDQAENR